MGFISKVKENKKIVASIRIGFILVFIALCILCSSLYVKLYIQTDNRYYPPEIEALLLTKIRILESEVLPVEHIKEVLEEETKEGAPPFNGMNGLMEYESASSNFKVLIDEFVDGLMSRRKGTVTREELLANLGWGTIKIYGEYVVFQFVERPVVYRYSYYPDGKIDKSLSCVLNTGIEKTKHYIREDEIDANIFYANLYYGMSNFEGYIRKRPFQYWFQAPDYTSPNYQISVEDYNLFYSDYLEGLVPTDFKLTIKNIHKYLEKK